jgi:hypothetical protein
MSNALNRSVVYALWLFGLFAVVKMSAEATPLLATTGGAVSTYQCEASVTPDEVTPNAEEAATIVATLSTGVGVVQSVSITNEDGEDTSGIAIEGAEATSPTEVTLTLNTSEAVVGSWKVNIIGESGTCSGVLAVVPAEEPAPAPAPMR